MDRDRNFQRDFQLLLLYTKWQPSSDSKVQGASSGWRRHQSWTSSDDENSDDEEFFDEEFDECYCGEKEKISVSELKEGDFREWVITVRLVLSFIYSRKAGLLVELEEVVNVLSLYSNLRSYFLRSKEVMIWAINKVLLTILIL